MTIPTMPISFIQPISPTGEAVHHASAAAGNVEATTNAITVMNDVLDGRATYERILLRAAAGAGKSYALKRMVEDAVVHARTKRVGVTAFANKQIFPLAEAIGTALGRDKVCLYVSKEKIATVSDAVLAAATVTSDYKLIPGTAEVILGTSHMFGYTARYLRAAFAVPESDPLCDVLFVDEAWQLPLHRYRTVEHLAPLVVGVGDVGQLPPLDPGQNPWRGDPGYNPYRAWPTAYEDDPATWATDLPAVWRPTAQQLPLWRAFYGDWDQLDCVAAPGDRSLTLTSSGAGSMDVWAQVASGVPTLLEVEGLEDPEAADIDQPLLGVLEDLLIDLLAGGFEIREKQYDAAGTPEADVVIASSAPTGDPLIAVLATPTKQSTTRPNWWNDSPSVSTCRRVSSSPRPSTRGRARPTGSPWPSTRYPVPSNSTSSTRLSGDSRSQRPEPPTDCCCWPGQGSTISWRPRPLGRALRWGSPGRVNCRDRPTSESSNPSPAEFSRCDWAVVG